MCVDNHFWVDYNELKQLQHILILACLDFDNNSVFNLVHIALNWWIFS